MRTTIPSQLPAVESISCGPDVKQRENEGWAQWVNRRWRWRMWRRQEPRPDLWHVPDFEVAAYRLWLTGVNA